ncbi:hypothetical protein QBC47DRAFT_18706 [Echria macrotheca]|uniref:Uncharacterized protein n=1 Tax=Echria macrotheca TaxID=438768 RepID=A0AAJ0FF34_9PEZI|nr:hypothetical protein QBC47DRAFT_18706 [Echria macrotheca]
MTFSNFSATARKPRIVVAGPMHRRARLEMTRMASCSLTCKYGGHATRQQGFCAWGFARPACQYFQVAGGLFYVLRCMLLQMIAEGRRTRDLPGSSGQDGMPAPFPLVNQTSCLHPRVFGSIMGRDSAAATWGDTCSWPRDALDEMSHCSELTLRLISRDPLNSRSGLRSAPGSVPMLSTRPPRIYAHMLPALPAPSLPGSGSGASRDSRSRVGGYNMAR